MRAAFRIVAALAVLIGMSCAAQAQPTMTGAGVPRSAAAAAAAFSGAGDVVAGAFSWSGLRAYSAATTGTRVANICNSGDANCADINSLANGKFDVTTAQGAPLNCGGAGGTCTIKTLYDQTGSTNCTGVACDYTQATIANRPTLVFNCVGTTNVCMNFNGTSQTMSAAGPSGVGAQPFTYSVVANSTNNSAQQSVFQGGPGTQVAYNNSGANTVFIYAGAVLNATATDGSWHALQGVANGGSSDMNVDGTAGSGNAGTGTPTTFVIGSANGSSQFFKGTATEFGFWTSAFSGAQSTSMSTNQHSASNGWNF